jgi:hypothetical protein
MEWTGRLLRVTCVNEPARHVMRFLFVGFHPWLQSPAGFPFCWIAGSHLRPNRWSDPHGFAGSRRFRSVHTRPDPASMHYFRALRWIDWIVGNPRHHLHLRSSRLSGSDGPASLDRRRSQTVHTRLDPASVRWFRVLRRIGWIGGSPRSRHLRSNRSSGLEGPARFDLHHGPQNVHTRLDPASVHWIDGSHLLHSSRSIDPGLANFDRPDFRNDRSRRVPACVRWFHAVRWIGWIDGNHRPHFGHLIVPGGCGNLDRPHDFRNDRFDPVPAFERYCPGLRCFGWNAGSCLHCGRSIAPGGYVSFVRRPGSRNGRSHRVPAFGRCFRGLHCYGWIAGPVNSGHPGYRNAHSHHALSSARCFALFVSRSAACFACSDCCSSVIGSVPRDVTPLYVLYLALFIPSFLNVRERRAIPDNETAPVERIEASLAYGA